MLRRYARHNILKDNLSKILEQSKIKVYLKIE